MGARLRVLRRRIGSVQSTKKITRAMELISASRIAKAQLRVEQAKPYSEQMAKVIANLQAAGAGAQHPLLITPEQTGEVLIVAISADRGLAGAYNANVIRVAERTYRSEIAKGRNVTMIAVGKKGVSAFRYKGLEVAESYEGLTDVPTYEGARTVAAEIIDRFESGRADAVHLVYTDFITVGRQVAVSRQLIPINPDDVSAADTDSVAADYEFEPSPSQILSRLLPAAIEAQVYAALLSASASEHASRQRAMKSATDNAEDLIKSLTRDFNQARQAEITTEISEIVGGAEALKAG